MSLSTSTLLTRNLRWQCCACHPKCRRGVIGCHGEQQLVDFARKVGAITRRGKQTDFGIDADG
jgi:hypothetical protein